ncbi:sensor histidine kinase [Flagellimonas beolgyonensis]|uniref:sensor histidine kinase n=1 Tax=Flagellimonas beolgyonensis TaxID=864064 RepID=UPI000F8E4A51|nr:histidine kinase [Allomuricauda beolgyonensis]
MMFGNKENPFKTKEIFIHLFGWLCLASFPLFISFTIFSEFHPMAFLRVLLPPVLFYVNYALLAPKLLLKKRVFTYIVTSVVFLVGFEILALNIPTLIPIDKLDLPQDGFLYRMRYVVIGFALTAFFLFGGVVRLIKHIYINDKLSRQNDIRKTRTELEYLKAQLNPHFLFNSLNCIYSLVRDNSKEASNAVIILSELMRYTLYESNQDRVLLSKDIENIKNYVSLQKLRLSNSEKVHLEIKGDYEEQKIAPLIMMTFIENAFKYGTDYDGRTEVHIVIQVIGNHLFFDISNLKGTRNIDKNNSGIGLNNVKGRLNLLYPHAHSLDIDKGDREYSVKLHLTLD